MKTKLLLCRTCGESFEIPVRRGRNPAYCGDTCRNAAQAAYREECAALGVCHHCPRAGERRPVSRWGLCEEHVARTSAITRRHALRRFVLTPEAYALLLAEQGGVCAVCKAPPGEKALAVDHDHGCCPGAQTCGACVRGLLCAACNIGIGNLGDDPARLRAAAAYLEVSSAYASEDPPPREEDRPRSGASPRPEA